jgi:hypothetical protein
LRFSKRGCYGVTRGSYENGENNDGGQEDGEATKKMKGFYTGSYVFCGSYTDEPE